MSESSEAPRTPGRPRSEEKRSAILEAAGDLFLTEGLAATSMDAVAARAGVSKQTVYSHFGDKNALFQSCIEGKLATYRLDDLPELADIEVREALEELAERFLNLFTDDAVVAMTRVVIGTTASQPEIGQLFYRTGPRRTIAAVARLLSGHVAAGRLVIDDVEEAAALFIDMLAAHVQRRMLMGVAKAPSGKARRRHIERTVDRYLRIFSPASKPA